MKKRILSIVLAICLVLTLVPTTVFADLTKETYVVAGVSALCGSNWDPNPEASPDNVMPDNGDGTYTKVYTNVAVMDGYQFKVVKYTPTGEQTWYGVDGGDESFKFNVKSVCDVTITFDTATLKITVTGAGVEIPTTLNVESMRAVGNGNGNWLNDVNWDPAADENLMAEVSPGVFEITYTDLDGFNNYQVKFAANGSWDNNWGGDYQGSGIESDAKHNFPYIAIEVPYVLADVTLRLDLTNFDYATKTGAKFTVTVVDKASTSSKTTEPSVSAYATKAQLMDETFAPDADGYDTNIGKLAFGINTYGKVQNWYILGKDTGIDGDNTVIFADSKFTFGYFEDNRDEIKTDPTLWSDCTYTGTTPSEVYPNHYGASDLRVALQGFANDTSFFTTAEQSLMNATTVETKDTKNSNVTYTTTDKLYLLNGYKDDYRIWAGSNDQIPLANESYWSSGTDFWLRTPSVDAYIDVISAVPGDHTIAHDVKDDGTFVQPASNLNLTEVVFSSAVTESPSSDGPVAGNIPFDKAMALRLDGSSMNIGTVEYDSETNTIKAQKGSISGKVALVVQGKNVVQKKDEIGEKDWYYSELVNEDYSISADLIMLACGLSSLDLDKCKIWLETEGTDGMIYAVNETKKIPSVEITNIDAPTVNSAFDTSALCATTGVSSTTPAVTWTPEHTTAIYNTIYTASVTLTADAGYKFADTTTATVNGQTATSVTKNDDSTLTVTYKFPAISNSNTDSYPSGEISIGTSSWKTFLNGITFNIFNKNTQTVTITANSNTVNIEYLLSDKELTVAELDKATFTAYNAPFNINPNNEYVIYAKLTNTSGNAIYINSNGIVLDSIAPVIFGVKNGKTYCSAQTVTVNEKYIDNVTVNGKTVKLNANNQFTLTAAEGTQKIVATDKAGNVSAKITVTVHDGHIDEDEDSFCDLCKTKIPVDSGEESDDQPEINPDDTKKDTGNKSPQTGNSFNSALWLVLLLSCGGVIIVSGAYSKRKKHSAK